VFASALLATVALNLPLLVGGAFAVALGATLVFLMRERNFRPAPREGRSQWAQAGATARGGVRLVRGHPALAGLEPLLWFGLINAGTLVLGYLAAEVLGRALDVGNVAVATRLLFVLNALTIVGVLAFALAGSFAFALGAFWFATLTRKLFYPLYLTWVNRGLDPNVRATVISISNQANSLGELAGGPVVGAVGTLASIRTALATAALVLSPALFLYGRAIRHDGVEPGLEAPNDTEKSN
jgi:DHA3 family tetracycline resistance protein-like MFS transporter